MVSAFETSAAKEAPKTELERIRMASAWRKHCRIEVAGALALALAPGGRSDRAVSWSEATQLRR
jgi:hypothetical protein